LNGKVCDHTASTPKSSALLDGLVIDDAKVFNNKLREWEDYYNYHRPTAASTARHPTNDYARKPRPDRNR